MKILFVVDYPGLAFDSIAKWAQCSLRERGDVVSIIYHTDSSFEEVMKNIARLKCDHVHFFWRKYLNDLIEHCSIRDPQSLEKFLISSKITFSVPDHLYRDEDELSLYMPLFYLVDGYILTSMRLYGEYSNLYHIPDPIQVIYDLNHKVTNLLKAPMEEPENNIRVLWVGNSQWGKWLGYEDFKGLESIIRPAVKSFEDSGVTLRAIDSDKNPQDDAQIEEAFLNSDIYVNASIHEGTPLPILEAFAAGKAIISTDVGVLREISGPLQQELICGRSVVDFVDRLKITQDRTFLKAVQKENREMAIRFVNNTGNFGWGKFVDTVAQVPRGEKKRAILENNWGMANAYHEPVGRGRTFRIKRQTLALLRSSRLARNIAASNPRWASRVRDLLTEELLTNENSTVGQLFGGKDKLPEKNRANTLAIFAPCWGGIMNSTKSIFDSVLPIPLSPYIYPETVDSVGFNYYIERIISLSPKKLVISGGDRLHVNIVKKLCKINPNLRIQLMWHGSQAQWVHEYERTTFFEWVDLAKSGVVEKIWVLKSGLEKVLSDMGIDAELLCNMPYSYEHALPRTLSNPVTIGIWADRFDWRKNAITQCLAISGLRNVICYHNCQEPTFEAIARHFDMPIQRISDGSIPHDEFLKRLSSIDINLYVTLSECSPMIPLESAMYGRPCLVGPTTNHFDDHQFLRDHLVVESPDDISSIHRGIQRVIGAYEEISVQLCNWVSNKQKEADTLRVRLNSENG